jgi:putative sigma-54 modulation protein
MQTGVTFRHMESHKGAKDYVKEKVQRLEKYIVHPGEVHVVLSAEKFRHMAEITIIGNGVTLNSQGRDKDLYAAIDQMVDKAERQIRERRGKTRRKRDSLSPEKAPIRRGRGTLESKEDQEIPAITRTKRTLAKSMSLEEAVAQMDLSREEFLVFVNSDSGELNVLHRGKDGGYEWVMPYSK